MIRKVSYVSIVLVALGGLVVGCSDDSSRVTSPGVETQWDDFLATGTDEPGVILDFEEYIEQGYYYPEDTSLYDYQYEDLFDDLGQPSDDDGPSNKDFEDEVGR